MIAARSRGLAAIAVPGDHAWQPAWAQLLTGRRVAIVMDADKHGRAAGRRIARDLREYADVQLVELAPQRTDGYDLTDWLLEHPEPVDIEGLNSRTPLIKGAANDDERAEHRLRRLHPPGPPGSSSRRPN